VHEQLRLVIRTPYEVVFDERVRSARVPAETGQVGLRPRGEPFVVVVEPGLVVLRTDAGVRFAATAGGLLDGDRDTSVLYTPFAAVGAAEGEVLAALDRAQATPDSELALRRRLGELERRIVRELRPTSERAEAVGLD
jgi:F0F1-type ATP synthase epsilon subunit